MYREYLTLLEMCKYELVKSYGFISEYLSLCVSGSKGKAGIRLKGIPENLRDITACIPGNLCT